MGTTKDTKPTKGDGSGHEPAKHAKSSDRICTRTTIMAGIPAWTHFAGLACLAGLAPTQPLFVSFAPFVVSRIEVHGVRGAGVAGDSTDGSGCG